MKRSLAEVRAAHGMRALTAEERAENVARELAAFVEHARMVSEVMTVVEEDDRAAAAALRRSQPVPTTRRKLVRR
jgi:hypothetical protein